jgi:mutator protein MutT
VTQHVQSALGVIERRGRFLVQKRGPGKFLAGYWEFPGGKREPGETWRACARRELREELGVAARVGRELMTLRYTYPGRKPKVFKVFRCTIIAGRPRPLASAALKWVSRARLRRMRFPPANGPLIALLAGSP